MKQPLSPYTLSEQMMYSTIRLEVTRADDQVSYGTAFRYSCTINGLVYNLIVTAKHNFEQARAVRMRFHRCNQLPDYKGQLIHDCYEIIVEELDGKFLFHPHEEIDLAALDFTPIHRAALENNTPIFSPNADEACIHDDHWLANNLSMVEELIMPGYPLAIFDDANNFPIFRRGTTASHPYVDFKNKPLGAIDIACHPGSSGSPVCIINEKKQWNGKSKEIVGVKKPILLGVLTDGVTYPGANIAKLPTQKNDFGAHTPINLGYYTKAKEVKFLGEKASEVFKGHPPVCDFSR
jgi:hypothetical protein